jgi:dolichyl-phosphate beta-glucosyltransferase
MKREQPMDASPTWCTVVVPCFNEAVRLPLDAFRSFLSDSHGIRFLFVNDGSTDQTLAVLQELEASLPGLVEVFNQQPNGGKAEAVRVGMLRAFEDSAVVGFWDADLATPLNAIPEMLGLFERDRALDMVFGVRVRLLGRHIRRDPLRHYLGRVFATAVSIALRLPIYDTQCGAKLFKVTPELRSMLQRPFLSRWIFDVEIIARYMAMQSAGQRSAGIYEYPLECWRDVAGSKLSPFDFVRSFLDLLRIRSHYPR